MLTHTVVPHEVPFDVLRGKTITRQHYDVENRALELGVADEPTPFKLVVYNDPFFTSGVVNPTIYLPEGVALEGRTIRSFFTTLLTDTPYGKGYGYCLDFEDGMAVHFYAMGKDRHGTLREAGLRLFH